MSAMRVEGAKRPPYFSTYTEVEVDIDPTDLEAAGWIYVGKGKDGDQPTTDQVIDVVVRWHDDNHSLPWRWCDHELCDALRGREPSS